MFKYGLYYPSKDGLMLKKKKKNTTQSHCDSPHLPKKGEEATQNMQKKVDEIK